jgi:sensor histidine kinase YesM
MAMKKNRGQNFKTQLRRAFLLYALTPMICLSFITYGVLFFVWYLAIFSDTNDGNSKIISDLNQVYASYSDDLKRMKDDARLDALLAGEEPEIGLYEDFYTSSNTTRVGCNFFVLDKELDILLSNTTNLPWYAESSYMEDYGIIKLIRDAPEAISIDITKLGNKDSTLSPVIMGTAIVRDGEVVGYITLDLQYHELMQVINTHTSNDILITDQNYNIAITTNHKYSDEFGKLTTTLRRDDRSFPNLDDFNYIRQKDFFDGRLYLFSITYTGVVNSAFLYVGIFLAVLFCILTFIMVKSAKRIAIQKTKVMDIIVERIKGIQEGDLDTTLQIDTSDELQIIGDAYNQMLGDIKHLISVNSEVIQRHAIAEIKQLESQFNPHFLFNTLETIRYMIQLKPKIACQMVLNLSSLLRYSINNEKNHVTLLEDIEHTKNYLQIQKFRLNDLFEYTIALDKDVVDCIIPKLIIQPIIENAVKYALKSDRKLIVNINAYSSGSGLEICIRDNGVSMSPEELERIHELLVGEENNSLHIGLYNVHRRIRLMYGNDYGIDITGEKYSGTVVKMRMPLCKRGDDNVESNYC